MGVVVYNLTLLGLSLTFSSHLQTSSCPLPDRSAGTELTLVTQTNRRPSHNANGYLSAEESRCLLSPDFMSESVLD